MPSKDDFHSELGIIDANGEFCKIDSIEPCTLESGCEIVPAENKLANDFSVEFDGNLSIRGREIFLVLIGACTPEQLKQNNWRKMHGLPMKRRAIRE